MKEDRNVPQSDGSLGTPKNIRNNSRRYSLTPKDRDFVKDCKAKLGAIAEDVNLPRPTAKTDSQSHVSMVNDVIVEIEQGLPTPQRQKIDAIIAEIRAGKPAPTKCWDCGCTTISRMNAIDGQPAYICALCNLWLGDVNPQINVKFELMSKLETLLWDLGRIPLSDEKNFQDTLETIKLIRSEIIDMESKP